MRSCFLSLLWPSHTDERTPFSSNPEEDPDEEDFQCGHHKGKVHQDPEDEASEKPAIPGGNFLVLFL